MSPPWTSFPDLVVYRSQQMSFPHFALAPVSQPRVRRAQAPRPRRRPVPCLREETQTERNIVSPSLPVPPAPPSRVFDVLKRHEITTPVVHCMRFPAGTVRDEIVINTGSLAGGLLVGAEQCLGGAP